MLSCSLLSEWLCEIAMDVQGYFHNSLLTHILGFCFHSGLLLLAFNHLGCLLLSLYSHRNKQSSQNRYISLLNAVLVYFAGRCGLMNSHHASIYPHGLEPFEKHGAIWETSSVTPRACLFFFLSCVSLSYFWSQNPEKQPLLKDSLQHFIMTVINSIWWSPKVHYQMRFVALLGNISILFPFYR